MSRDFKYNQQIPSLIAGYNLDDGVIIGAALTLVNYAYLKKPEASRQRIVLGHSLSTKAFYFKYHAQFNEVFGKTGLVIDAETLGPKNTENFFGLGNETIYDSANETITFYRSRYNVFNLNPAFQFKLGSKIKFDIGPSFQYFKMDESDNEGRFIADPALNKLDEPNLFSTKFYTGIQMDAIIDTRDHIVLPSRGIYWKTSFKSIYGLNKESNDFTQLRSDLSLFMSFHLPARLVIADRVGGGFTGGNPSFFQHHYIGGTHLMGFRKNRFAGTSFLYNNFEFRYKLLDFRTYLFPGSLGIIGYKDIGRVWIEGENSSKWHNGIGGGIYLSPVNMLVVTAIFGHSREENLPYVTLGFRF
ncbi:Surface antigen [compost metagenome]